MSYAKDSAFAASMLPAMHEAAREFVYRNRLIQCDFQVAPIDVDRNDGIDVFCEPVSGIKFAYRVVRLNRERFFEDDFTIRFSNSRPGCLSEWEKILSGHYAEYLIVGLQDQDEHLQLQRAKLIDVHSIREQVISNDDLRFDIEVTKRRVNHEINKYFVAPRYDSFPKPVVIDEISYADFPSASGAIQMSTKNTVQLEKGSQ